MKSSEIGIRKLIPMKNNNINSFNYVHIGPENIDDWLEWVKKHIDIAKNGNDDIQPAKDKESFLLNCQTVGLKVTYPEDFLRIYWKRK